MRTVIRPLHIVGGLIALFLGVAVCGCRTHGGHPPIPIRPPFSATEVAGVWIGFTSTDTDLYRLDLRGDSTGMLTRSYTGMTNQETLRFEISRWHIATNNVLTCSFTQHSVHEPVIMACQMRGECLEALLRNGEGGWKESVLFWRPDDLDRKLRVLLQ
jgi:hypothetical protein